ncbi:MAG: ABC transporter ATP-binding protein [Deltaproteobacteria bacterium]|nr:ABC transporter ATP-binding protein [Deltaproteobacteria bacterium]
MSETVIIETENLTKMYKAETAVSNLSFTVNQGEIFGFLGPNGAGKTTTLLMLMGLTEPTSGSARVLGINPTREPIKVKRKIGYLQENMGFYRDMNALQSLAYIAALNGIESRVADGRIEDALTMVGLKNEIDKQIGAYSRGMRQRLGIAELLVKNPEVAFLDEPTLGLDPESTNRITGLIQRLCAEKKMTVLLSSHLLHQVQKLCDRVGIMIDGHMVAQGSMDQLAEEKLGIGKKTRTLEEVYMQYFQES